jgi:hypothetical protein
MKRSKKAYHSGKNGKCQACLFYFRRGLWKNGVKLDKDKLWVRDVKHQLAWPGHKEIEEWA